MRSLTKGILVLAILAGYILNMYFLTADPKMRDYQWVNKVGIIVVPLGAVMGGVYGLDRFNLLPKNENVLQEK